MHPPEKVLSLANNLPSVALILADDPFLTYWVEKTLCTLSQSTQKKTVRKIAYEGDWNQLLSQLGLKDLFNTPAATVIHVAKPALFKDRSIPALLEATQRAGHLVVFTLDKITPAQQKTTWYKALSQASTVIPTKALPAGKVSVWLKSLSAFYQLPLSAAVQQDLCLAAEYDPACLEQCLIQLSLQAPTKPIDLAYAKSFMMTLPQQSPAYQAVDSILRGDLSAFCTGFPLATTTLDQAHAMYWLLIKRLRSFLQLKESALMTRKPLHALFGAAKIWPQQQATATRALNAPLPKLYTLYRKLCDLERTLKGQTQEPFFATFFQCAQTLCHTIQQANTPLTKR